MASSLLKGLSDTGVCLGELSDVLLSETDILCLLDDLVEVSPKWERLGIALRLPGHVISQCKDDDNIKALYNILHKWVQGSYKGAFPATLENLKQRLGSPIVGEGLVAHKLGIELQSGQTTVSYPAKGQSMVSCNSTISSEAEHLIQIYSKQREVPRSTWPPVGTNTFISLVLIKQSGEIARNYDYSVRGDMDDIVKSKETVDYEKIFAAYVEGGLVLVEGRPGSGKTTLVHKIARDWASGRDILTNAKMVFLVPLRVLDHTKDSHTLSDILKLFYFDMSNINSVSNEINKLQGKGVCFILDGLDEYSRCDSRSSVVYALIQKRFFPAAMVIVTSRPVATADLRKDCTVIEHIEVLGFSKDQIYKYIDNFPFVHSASSEVSSNEELKAYLEVHQNILHMCYLPVHAAMVCFLHHYSETIPNTETKIYEEFIRLILLRSFSRTDRYAQLPSLGSLCGQQAEWFKKLCHLAFDMTIQSKQVVHQRDTVVFLKEVSSQSDECGLGLVTIDHTIAMFGFTNTYTFLHLTLQEYLAAYHIGCMTKNEQVKILEKYGRATNMNNVLVFYCGMTHFTEGDARLDVVKSSVYGLRCAFESQQDVVCDSVVGIEGRLVIIDYYLTLVDLSSMAYVISKTCNNLHILRINRSHLSAYKLKYFFGSHTSRNYSSFRPDQLALLTYLDLTSNSLGLEGVTLLVNKLNVANVQLVSIVLDENSIGSEGARVIVEDLKCRQHLRELSLSNNCINGMAVWGGLKYWTDLKYLFVDRNTVNVASLLDGIVNRSHKYDENTSNNLQRLDVSNCHMNSSEMKILINGLKVCTGLKKLYLSCNSIGSEGAVHLCDELKCWQELTQLSIRGVGIGGDGAVFLAEGLKVCSSLEWINLSSNEIGGDGAIALAKCLKYCNVLSYVNLHNNAIGSAGALALCEELKSCPKLKTLILSDNGIESKAKTIIKNLFDISQNIRL